MNAILLIAILISWTLVLFLGFLVLGVLRSLGLMNWRLDQLELTRPSRLGRDGLKVGKKAPDFTLPCTAGGEVSLHDFAGRKVLLVFTQSGCGPCHDMAPEFNRVQEKGEHQVLLVNNGELGETSEWAKQIGAQYPVLVQDKFNLSKRYEIFATPFAFVIDEQGVIASNGIVGSTQYLGYVLTGAGNRLKKQHDEAQNESAGDRESDTPASETEPRTPNSEPSSTKELTHV